MCLVSQFLEELILSTNEFIIITPLNKEYLERKIPNIFLMTPSLAMLVLFCAG